MDLGKWGVFAFTDVLTPAQLAELAQRTEQLDYTALWYPEVLGYEAFALGSFLLTQTTRLVIASGIANIYARDATAVKQGQHTLATLSGGRFLLGLGVSHVPLVEEARGHQYRPPVAAMRAYLDAMDKAVATAPAVEEPPPTVLAALGPQMTALASARTAGALPYNVTPSTRRGRGPSSAQTAGCVSSKRCSWSRTRPRPVRSRARRWRSTYPCPTTAKTGSVSAFGKRTWRTAAATDFWTPWSPGAMRRPFNNASTPMLMREPVTSASSPCIQTGSPSRTSRPWPPSPPSGTGACVPAACRTGLRRRGPWLDKIHCSNPYRRFADTPPRTVFASGHEDHDVHQFLITLSRQPSSRGHIKQSCKANCIAIIRGSYLSS
jgi:Luciferase-like monooxygenase